MAIVLKTLVFLLIYIKHGHSTIIDNSSFYENTWINIFQSFDKSFRKNSEEFVKQIKSNEISMKISPFCANSLLLMFENISEEEWAAKMVDSSGRLPSGILSGTVTNLGDFDQCIKINELFDDKNGIKGKYCLLTIRPLRNKYFESIVVNKSQINSNWFEREVNQWLEVDNSVPFSNGICFPSHCHQNEIKIILTEVYKTLNLFNFDINYCQTDENITFRSEVYIALFLIKTSLFLLLIGTLLDIYFTSDTMIIRILKCFSIIRNIKILFRISTLKNLCEYQLQFIHGLRVLGIVWVILAHSSGFILITSQMKILPFARYPEDAIESSKSVLAQYIINASLAVQIFFIISGFLTVYSTLSNRKLEINFIQYIALRWFRFTPPLIGMMCFTICLQMFGSGPLFHTDILEPIVQPCYDNWWAHILYVINWFDLRQMCGVQTWYLSADFQLHIISYVMIYFFYKNQSISRYFSYLMIITGAILPVLLVALGIDGIPRVDVLFKPKYEIPSKGVKLFFFGTHVHLISYFSGSLLAFALLNKKSVSLNKNCNAIVWTVVSILTITLPLLSYPVLQEDIHPVNSTISNAVMIVILLSTWSFCVSWIVYNCAISRAGILSKILSANFFQPLSRLSFCAYLSHLMLIWFNVQQTRFPISINAITMAQYFCTILVETFLMALILYLTFEAPFVNLIKMLFIRRQDTNQTQEEDTDYSVNSQNTININMKVQNNNVPV